MKCRIHTTHTTDYTLMKAMIASSIAASGHFISTFGLSETFLKGAYQLSRKESLSAESEKNRRGLNI